MIETVVSVDLMVEEEIKIKKNRLAPDFLHGDEKRMCIVSGMYGDELQGQYICYQVIKRIKSDFDKLSGIVDVYPSLNPMGLDSKTREIPGSGMDMNVIFPGSRSGALGEYTASCVFDDIKGADLCVDIHSSNLHIHEIPQVRINANGADGLLDYAKKIGLDMVWVHPSTSVLNGSLAYALNNVGVKAMVVESGVAYRIDQEYCNKIVDGLFVVMKEMGIWSGAVSETGPSRIVYDKDVSYINAESSGIFIPEVSIFDRVGKSDTIGTIVNVITGSVEEIITAGNDGIICSLRDYPVIEEGSLIARILGGEADE
ncbi:MAG: M14 family metallopeptidase [Clostridium sp.]|nr:M14 family metallopeptidase [Clostridium sp.]MCM1172897.1 M14 family metallopeptidase [Clostridium sp.]MCM1207556.1 M14 family metallopeptidase [Ruminococcus sp.]